MEAYIIDEIERSKRPIEQGLELYLPIPEYSYAKPPDPKSERGVLIISTGYDSDE